MPDFGCVAGDSEILANPATKMIHGVALRGYGSEIETPRLDALASAGVRMTQFYNTAKCHASRVALLTGLYCDQAGSTSLRRGTTIARELKRAGYFTAMTGKWHLDGQPTDHGFDRYFGHLSGATNFFTGDNTFRLNGKPFNDFGDDFYTTVANTDYAIRFADEAIAADKPFLLYVAHNAPHYPLHVLKEDYEKYRGRYDSGCAHVGNTPFRYYKQNSHEGGVSSPAILHWPAAMKANAGSFDSQPGH